MGVEMYDISELPGSELCDKRRRQLKYQEQADLMHENPGKYVLLESFNLESRARQVVNNINAGQFAAFWFGVDPLNRAGRQVEVDAVARKTGETEYSVYAAYTPGMEE